MNVASLHAQENEIPNLLPNGSGKIGIGTVGFPGPVEPLHIMGNEFGPLDQAFIRFGYVVSDGLQTESYVGHIGVFSPFSSVWSKTHLPSYFANTGDMIIQADETSEDLILTTRSGTGNIRLATTGPGSTDDKQRMLVSAEGNIGVNTNFANSLVEINFAQWVGHYDPVYEKTLPRILFTSNNNPANSQQSGYRSPSMWFLQYTGHLGPPQPPINIDPMPEMYAFQIDVRPSNGHTDYGVLNINTNFNQDMFYDKTKEPDISKMTAMYTFTRDGKMSINHDNPDANLHVLGTARFNDPATNEDMSGDHDDYRVLVEAKLVAKEIIVTLTNWADHVFDPNRPLQDLMSLEQDINKLGHLPGVPSEQEVLENGVNMGDMQVIMLEKIEELTLHMIELKKQNASLKAEIEDIKGGVK